MAILDHAEESLIRLNELAKMLKAVREERDLTLIEAAKEIGLSSATLSRIENSKYTPRVENLGQICEWLGVPASRFIESESPSNQRSEGTLEGISVHLRADRKLSAEAASELIDVIKTLYNRYADETMK
ncbi:MAG: helix-turn-helix transcriptional regulator [Pleurocapsa sp. SU_196_0]|nr:helix-turn-helix transcriptional regulator [Pleurocapsa sp. SU_196_0]